MLKKYLVVGMGILVNLLIAGAAVNGRAGAVGGQSGIASGGSGVAGASGVAGTSGESGVAGASGVAGCPDVKIIFARGSGEERWTNISYKTLKTELKNKLDLTELSYVFEDLDYPAINVTNPLTLLGAFVSGGEAYDFGASVSQGVEKMVTEVTDASCPQTKYVIAGYSQGAMVVLKTLRKLEIEGLIYAATFGDPKLYLPEGAGVMPAACQGQNLSNYRIYVPDCRAYSGVLGGYNPYQSDFYVDKLGTWCNKADFFCSSHLSMRDHENYVADGLYSDASKLIFDKIVKAFGLKNEFVSLHDTAILIDSTGSMRNLIEQYKAEALALAEKTLANGGRVALYDYRDLAGNYEPKERCNFETCTLETFQAGLAEIEVDGGGDEPESLLSSGLKVMQRLNWKYGSTKSVVVLTDASYHTPDLDGVTFDEVVALSKKIDPVNFYVITPGEKMNFYKSLTAATDGQVVASTSDLSILTRTIIERYDSLPRVEEDDGFAVLPEIGKVSGERVAFDRVKLTWETTGTRTLIALNDAVLGVTEASEIVLEEIDFSTENTVRLVPLTDSVRGVGVEVGLDTAGRGGVVISAGRGGVSEWGEVSERGVVGERGGVGLVVPKVPNTGRH